jgi:cyclopropane fatty-acyl-phospholipid synthase-like methyltransferase
MATTQENINNRFFEGLYKDVWKKLINPALTRAECDFIQEIADLQENDTVLDIMCGYGRHALELARRGMNATAIDNLQDYITEIDIAVAEEALHVKAFARDALEPLPEGPFKAIICMGNSFSFFDKEDAQQLLQNISSSLQQGGTFILNSWMVAEIAIRHFKEKDWMQVEDFKYLLDYKYQFYSSRIESEHTIIRNDGATEVIKGVDYIFTLSELEDMFEKAGLKTINLYSTPRKKRFTLGDSTIYIVAEKL